MGGLCVSLKYVQHCHIYWLMSLIELVFNSYILLQWLKSLNMPNLWNINILLSDCPNVSCKMIIEGGELTKYVNGRLCLLLTWYSICWCSYLLWDWKSARAEPASEAFSSAALREKRRTSLHDKTFCKAAGQIPGLYLKQGSDMEENSTLDFKKDYVLMSTRPGLRESQIWHL